VKVEVRRHQHLDAVIHDQREDPTTNSVDVHAGELRSR
jgi:hypothetical protein